jgi:uncharacterized delta-60 repeat protein
MFRLTRNAQRNRSKWLKHVTLVSGVGLYLFNACALTAAAQIAGDLDLDFAPTPNLPVYTAVTEPAGTILIGGTFVKVDGVPRGRIARLNANGTLDSVFDPAANDGVFTISVLPDGNCLFGGSFTTVGGVTRNHIARVNNSGNIDAGFVVDIGYPTSIVFSLAAHSNGAITFGGYFPVVAGVTRHGIAQVAIDGTLQSTFNPDPSALIYPMVIGPQGKIFVAGDFTRIGPANHNRIACLDQDGSVALQFNPSVNESVRSLAIQGDGKIVIGGAFTNVDGVTRNHLARLNDDGSLDSDFAPDVDKTVDAIAVQTDGKIIIGGHFTNVSGFPRNYIARLLPNGSPDAGFDPNANYYVYSITIQANGKILMGGPFTTVGGIPRSYFARLNNDPALETLTASRTEITWLRQGASPETHEVTFQLSVDDGHSWEFLGVGSRTGRGWELTGLNLPEGARVRARARVNGGSWDSSSGYAESIASVPESLRITEVQRLSDGSCRLKFKGIAGGSYKVLTSTRIDALRPVWTNLGGATEISAGLFEFRDPDAPLYSQRFYQLESP